MLFIFNIRFLCCLITLRVIQWTHLTEILFIPYVIWDVIYIILVATTYSYVFCEHKKHKKQIKRQNSSNKEHFKLLIPTLIIVTFIIFGCIPDFTNIFTYFQFLQGKVLLFNILAVFYRIGCLIDPLMYIYDSKLFRKKKTNYRIPSATSSQIKTSHL